VAVAGPSITWRWPPWPGDFQNSPYGGRGSLTLFIETNLMNLVPVAPGRGPGAQGNAGPQPGCREAPR
jgi:hypothetical protein